MGRRRAGIAAVLAACAVTGCRAAADTPLTAAALRGETAEIERLVKAGADIDSTASGQRSTPLMMAAGYGDADIVELLLARGADPRRKSVSGYTALVAAVRGVPDIDRFTVGSCQTATVKALLKAAPDLTLPDNGMGRTARWAASLGNCQEVTRLLDASRQGR